MKALGSLLPRSLQKKAITHLKKADPKLAKIIVQAGACTLRIQKHLPIDLYLIRAVVYQQLHGKAAAAILKRTLDFLAVAHTEVAAKILHAKPEHLRACGLSASKLAAIRALAAASIQGELPNARRMARMSDDAIIAELVKLRGIGPWTAQMLLLFRLGRPDVLAEGDYGLRKGFMLAYGKKQMPTPKELLAHGERWRPYRSIASWYLWRAGEVPG